MPYGSSLPARPPFHFRGYEVGSGGHTTDTVLKAEDTAKTFTTDAYLVAQVSHTTDAIIKAEDLRVARQRPHYEDSTDTQTITSDQDLFTWNAGTEFTADVPHLIFETVNVYGAGTSNAITAAPQVDGALPSIGGTDLNIQVSVARPSFSSVAHMSYNVAYVASPSSTVSTNFDIGSGTHRVSRFNRFMLSLAGLTEGTDWVQALTDFGGTDSGWTNATWNEAETISFTPTQVGEEWLIVGSFSIKNRTNNGRTRARLLDDNDTEVLDSLVRQGNSYYSSYWETNNLAVFWHYTATGTSAETWKLEGYHSHASDLFGANLIAIRLDALSDNHAHARTASQSTTNGAKKLDDVTITTPENDVVVLGYTNRNHGIYNSGLKPGSIHFSDDNNSTRQPTNWPDSEYGGGVSLNGQGANWGYQAASIMGMTLFTSGSTTYELWGRTNFTAYTWKDANIVAFELGEVGDHTTDAIIKAEDTAVTHTTDAFLVPSSTHTTDAHIVSRVIITTCFGYAGVGFPFGLSSGIPTSGGGEICVEGHTTDVHLVDRFTKTHTTDAWLKAEDTAKTFTTDAILDAGATEVETTFTTDARIVSQVTGTHTTDSIVKALDTTATFTTDAHLVDRITTSHTTDAFLKLFDVELTHTTGVLVKDYDVATTFTTDAILKALGTAATHTTDAIHQQQDNLLTSTTDSIVLLESNPTHTTDALLRAEITGSHSTDAIVKRLADTETFTTDAVLQAEFTAAHTTDAWLAAEDTAVTHNTEAILQAEFTATHTSDALIKDLDVAGGHTTDAWLKAEDNERTQTVDALLKGTFTPTFTTDALLVGTELSHTTDAIVIDEDVSITFTTDAHLQATESPTFTTDAWLKAEDTVQDHTADAIVKDLGVTATHTTDAVVLLETELTHTTDALLKALATAKTHTTDAHLVSGVESGHSTDAIVIDEDVTKTFTTDAHLVDRIAITHTTDAILKAEDTALTHTTDSVNRATFTRVNHTDAIIMLVVEPTHTTDAVVKLLGAERTHTTDAIVIDEDVTKAHTTDAITKALATDSSHTTDGVLQAQDTALTHTADAFLVGTKLSHTTDAILQAVVEGSHTTDAVLKDFDVVRTFTSDAVILLETSISHTTDAVLQAVTSLNFTTDAVIKALSEPAEHTTDGIIQLEAELTHTTDALVKLLNAEANHTTDGFLVGTKLTHTTDAIVQDTPESGHSTDVIVKRLDDTETHTTDAHLVERYEPTHTTDAWLKAEDTALTHTTDAYIITLEVVKTFTTDAILIPSREHTTDAILKAEDTPLTHTTSAYLGQLRSTPGEIIWEHVDTSHNSASWGTVLTLDTNDGLKANTKYMVFWQVYNYWIGNTSGGAVRLNLDGTEQVRAQTDYDGDYDVMDVFMPLVLTTGATPSITVEAQGLNMNLGNITVAAVNIDTLTEGVDYWYNEDTTAVDLGTSYAAYAQVTVSTVLNEEYAIFVGHELDCDSTNRWTICQLTVDETTSLKYWDQYNATPSYTWWTTGQADVYTGDGSSHTFEAWLASWQSSTHHDHESSRILVVPASTIPFTFDTAGDVAISTTYAEVASVTINPADPTSVLAIARSRFDPASTNQEMRARIQYANTTEPSTWDETEATGWTESSVAHQPIGVIAVKENVSGSTDVDYDARTVSGSATVEQTDLVVFEVGGEDKWVDEKFIDHTTDVRLIPSREHTTDAFLVGTKITHTTDARVTYVGGRSHTTDAHIVGRESHTTDAVLQLTGSPAHTTDAIVALQDVAVTHTTDAVVDDRVITSHTTDAVLMSTTSPTHTTDAVLLELDNQTRDFTTDAVLLLESEVDHTTDSRIVRETDLGSVSFGIDIDLDVTLTVSGTGQLIGIGVPPPPTQATNPTGTGTGGGSEGGAGAPSIRQVRQPNRKFTLREWLRRLTSRN